MTSPVPKHPINHLLVSRPVGPQTQTLCGPVAREPADVRTVLFKILLNNVLTRSSIAPAAAAAWAAPPQPASNLAVRSLCDPKARSSGEAVPARVAIERVACMATKVEGEQITDFAGMPIMPWMFHPNIFFSYFSSCQPGP